MASTPTSKRALAAQHRARAAERQGLEPPSSLIERDEHGKAVACTPAGLKLIERLARTGAPQSKLAAALGIPLRRLKTLFDRNEGENPTRLAYERGYADFENEIVQRLLTHGKTNPIPLIFLAKAKLGWKEGDQPPASVQNNVSIVLPKPMSQAEYFQTLGISAPLDYSKPLPKQREPAEPPALPAPPRSLRGQVPWPIVLGQERDDESKPQPQIQPTR